MKSLLIYLTSYVCLAIQMWCIFLYPSLCNAQQKHAIIVALSNYPKESGFKRIHSNNDVPIIYKSLITLGFNEKQITILENEHATKQKIVDALGATLLKKLGKGDIVYFHFSGHGQQILDYNKDEVDGLDESHVPYDAYAEFKPGFYEGQSHLTDDEMDTLLTAIRKKLGPNGHVLVTIDACHSGSSLRGIGSARGVVTPFAPKGFVQPTQIQQDINQSEATTDIEKDLAPRVAFYASRANQLNYEITAEDDKQYGALSYAFSKAVATLDKEASYQQLYDKIRLEMANHSAIQMPEVSGILFQPVLGGTLLECPDYFIIKAWEDEQQVILECGFLNNITEGNLIGFYPMETRNISISKPLVTGIVAECAPNYSTIELNGKLSELQSKNVWAYVLEENFGGVEISIQIDSSAQAQLGPAMKELMTMKFLKHASSQSELVLNANMTHFKLFTQQGVEIGSVEKNSPKLLHTLKDVIIEYGRSQYFRRLNQSNNDILIKCKVYKVKNLKTVYDNPESQELLTLHPGDTIEIEAVNVGKREAYFNILDIQPDHKTNVLFPGPDQSPSDYLLQPNASKKMRLTVSPPYGQEMIKLIASKSPINLRPLHQRRSVPSGDPEDPISNALENNFGSREGSQNRGSARSTVPKGEINVDAVQFIIK